MSDMGTFRTTLSIEHPGRRGLLRALADVLVDTGSELTWIPKSDLAELGIPPERRDTFVLANGQVVERDVGFAIVHVEGVSTADDVVFAEAGDLVLLGARSLEGLNLRIDPRTRRLVGAGPIVTAAALRGARQRGARTAARASRRVRAFPTG